MNIRQIIDNIQSATSMSCNCLQAYKQMKADKDFDAAAIEAKAPPGWEGTVKHMKKHSEISNPWALAWYMKNKGDTPHH